MFHKLQAVTNHATKTQTAKAKQGMEGHQMQEPNAEKGHQKFCSKRLHSILWTTLAWYRQWWHQCVRSGAFFDTGCQCVFAV